MAVKRSKLGEVELDVVESEELDYSNDVTDHPVETGEDVSDHVKNKPIGATITGVCAGPMAAQKRQQLVSYRNNRQPVLYTGRNILRDMVITGLSTIHDKEVGDGFKFTIILRQVRIAVAKKTNFSKPDPVTGKQTQQQTKPVTKKGKVQPINVIEAARKERKTVYDRLI